MDYLGGPHVVTRVLENETSEQKRGRGKGHRGRMVRGTLLPALKLEEVGSKPRNVGGLWKLEKAVSRKEHSPADTLSLAQ